MALSKDPTMKKKILPRYSAPEGIRTTGSPRSQPNGSAQTSAPSGWRPIETAPTDGTYVLLVSPAHGRVIGAHVGGDVWHFFGVGAITGKSERPTHWMPLPAPPAEGR